MRTRFDIGKLGLVATLVATLLLACSSPPQLAPSSSGAGTTGAKPNGSLMVVRSHSIDPLDPAAGPLASSAYTTYAVGVLDSLTTLDSKGNVVPQLAERWEISDDGLTHTFYLRKGVKFHDGSDLTAADVKFSMERMLSPEAAKNVLSGAVLWRSWEPKVEQKDDYTVVVHIKTPQFELLKPVMDFGGVLVVVPKKYIEDKGVDYFRKNPVGSGPWKVVNLVLGDHVDLEANENYWDTTKIPKFKNLTIRKASEEQTRVAMLKTGEADIADVSPESAVTLKAGGMRIKTWDSGSQAHYAPLFDPKNAAQYAFGDIRVRKATSLAINRQEMADKLFNGYAEPGILNRVQRTFDFFDANALKADPYDPEGAKKLLAEAGYANGFNTKVWDNGGGSILSTFEQALAGYWRKVGINAALEPIDPASLLSVIRTYSDPKVWNTVFTTGIGGQQGYGPTRFDIAAIFHSKVGLFRNHTNKRLDELIDLYPMTKDPAERLKIAREASILAKNEYIDNSVLIPSAILAIGPKIGDLTPIHGQGDTGAAYATATHAK